MRADANQIALRVVRNILDACKPGSVTVNGKVVTWSVSRGPEIPWPEEGVRGLDQKVDGAWPRNVGVTCTWEGGRCALQVRAAPARRAKYRDQVGVSVRVEDNGRQLVWITFPLAIADEDDGTSVRVRVAVSTFQRKKDASQDVGERLNTGLSESLRASGLPRISSYTAELCQFEVPSGNVLGGADAAFTRLIYVALLKLDFVDRGSHARSRGNPLFDLAQWGIDPSANAPSQVEEGEEEDEPVEVADSPGPRPRRYWAGGYGDPERMKRFLEGSHWQIGWARDSPKAPARRTWKRFADVEVGDWFAIKGLGGAHDLVVRFVGEVSAVDSQTGRVELRQLDVPLYKGKAPTGANAGSWHDTLLQVEREDAIKLVFGQSAGPNGGPQPPRANLPPLNQILYGPPGTGKTYELRNALIPRFTRIAGERRGIEAASPLVEDLTWFGTIALALHDLGGHAKVDDLLEHRLLKAKYAAQAIPSPLRQMVWGCLGQHAVQSSKTVKMQRRFGELIFDKKEDSTWFLAEKLPDSLADTARKLREQRTPQESRDYTFVTFHQAYGYEEFIEGIRPRLQAGDEEEAVLSYALEDGVFLRAARAALRLTGYAGTLDEFCQLPHAERVAAFANAPPYAVFIDEINRGNVARILGELITLLEPDKRLGAPNEIITTLPYSRKLFGVPGNLHVIGTMNTADRSVEALDVALRRRFEFKEFVPRYDLLDFEVEGEIDVDGMLIAINRRLEKLIDRDHCIGHAYLLELREDGTIDDLKRVFRDRIIPLLQEYFFGDWGKIGLVLGKAFVQRRDAGAIDFAEFDHDDRDVLQGKATWEIVDFDKLTNLDFQRIYEHGNPD